MTAAPILLSWCPKDGSGVPDPNDPCYPCKPKPKPPPPPTPAGTVYTTTGGWYGLVFGYTDITGSYWVAAERNVLYDANPGYLGYAIGQFADSSSAVGAAADTIAHSQPITTEPVIVPVGPGTGHPPSTTRPGTIWVGVNGSTVTQ